MNNHNGAAVRAPSPADSPWGIGVEVDLSTALAFARAAVTVLQKLSPQGKALVAEALEREAALLEIQADPMSRAAAQSVLQVLREAA